MQDTRLIAEAPPVPALFRQTLATSLQIEDADRIRNFYFTTRKLLWTFAIAIAALATLLAGLLFARESAFQSLKDDMERDYNNRILNFSRNYEERSSGVTLATPEDVELAPKIETGKLVGKSGSYFVKESASSEKVFAGRMEVLPGQTLTLSIGGGDPQGDEVLLIHEGEGTISWPGKSVKAKAGSVVFLPSAIVPEITNSSNLPMRLEYVRWIARTNLPARKGRPAQAARGTR